MHQESDPFSRIVESYGALVWRTAYRLLRGSDSTAECFQNTFLEFLRVARRTDIERPAGLLVRIAACRAVDHLRSRSAERREVQSLVGDESSSDPGPWQEAAGHELAERLRAAFVTLPEQQAAVFVMTQLENLAHSEVAAALKVSTNHVGVLLFRARATLQKQLKDIITLERE